MREKHNGNNINNTRNNKQGTEKCFLLSHLRTKIRFQLAPLLAFISPAHCRRQRQLRRVLVRECNSLFSFSRFHSTPYVSVVIIYHYSYMLIASARFSDSFHRRKLDAWHTLAAIMSHRQQWVEWREPKIVFHMTLSN